MSFSDRIKAAFNGNNNAASSNLSEQAFQWAVDQRSRGNQIELFCGPPPGINLQAGEAVYGCLPGTTLMEPHSDVPTAPGTMASRLGSPRGCHFGLVV